MGLNSTPLLSYREIKTDGIDLFYDAWGFYPQYHDVIDCLKRLIVIPDKKLTSRLIEKIRKNH